MTNEKELSGKKEAIYGSVWNIYVGGKDLGLIRMGEISEASGIPKGTIYEYFRTKDQLIAEAVIWSIGQEVSALCERVEKAENFDQKWDMVLEWVRSPAAQSILMIDFISGDKMPESLKGELMRLHRETCCGDDTAVRVMNTLLEAGQRDGVLESRGSHLARRSILYSAIAPVLMYGKKREEFKDTPWEEVKAYSKKLLVVAFKKD
ncbi:TetR/AcrR family transcriptional regulator [Qiania dongpingensis]|uniref:TetR/AcrR family transcriptional regulator n=1 Tax=Qiania dongpingensis TaxID=2763669 RepID=A0A7G9G636_9FIRM|nr:TetR/AcrR family transcriptional regulator [Qiania dongpingensis]QNM06268.1 TetR/AcrR family transcriptional regulator [Qiania dongpingensis]